MMQSEKEISDVYKVVLYGKTGRDMGDIKKAIQKCVGDSAEVEITFCPTLDYREVEEGYNEHFDHRANPSNWARNMAQKIYSQHKDEMLVFFTGLKDYLKGEGYKWHAIEIILNHYIDHITTVLGYDLMCLLNYQFLEDQDYKNLKKYKVTAAELKGDDWHLYAEEDKSESDS